MVSSIYQDFSKLRFTLPTLRVEDLKSILRNINSYLMVSARLTGRKDELIHRIESYLQEAIGANNTDSYERMRTVIYQHCREPFVPPSFQRNTATTNHPNCQTQTGITNTTGSSSVTNRATAPTVDFGSAPLTRVTQFDHSQTKSDPAFGNPVFGTTSTPTSMIRPTAFQPPCASNSITITPTHPANASAQIFPTSSGLTKPSLNPITTYPPNGPSHHHSSLPAVFSNSPSTFNRRSIPINFAKSPFYNVDSSVSMVAVCHRAAQNDRKSVSLSLIISSDQKAKLAQSTQYQLRMFCTSETFYSHPSYGPIVTSAPPALIEFPTTLEIKLNNCLITSNLKGIKKQPGTTAPPNLALVPGKNGIGHALDLKDGKANQIEIAYSNSDKRFYFVVYLIEYIGVYGLIKNLKASPKRTEEQVLREITKSSGDDDVMASASVVSLMDPIVFTRIKTPIRSLKCNHVQCYDAEMFYTMMEQTPTWLCPVCNVKLRNDDIMIDEYFESILKAAPSSIQSVVIEADGKWHDERFECGTSVQKDQVVSKGNTGSRFQGGEEDDILNDRRLKRKVSVLELESEDDQDLRSTTNKRNKPSLGFSSHCIIDLTSDD